MRQHRVAISIAVLLSCNAAFAAEPSAERQDVLLHLLKQDCGSCHGMTMKGGLGPALLPSRLAGRSDAVLAHIIVDGVPGTPMPPWGFEISREEALWLVRRMKQGVSDEN